MAEDDLKFMQHRQEDEESLEEGECSPRHPNSPNLSQIKLPTSSCYSPAHYLNSHLLKVNSMRSHSKPHTQNSLQAPNIFPRVLKDIHNIHNSDFSFLLHCRAFPAEVERPRSTSMPVAFFKQEFTHRYLRNFEKAVDFLFQDPSIHGKSLHQMMY